MAPTNKVTNLKVVKKDKKYYTIDEVLDKKIGKTWIVLDHNGEKPIYDVKKWIPAHPGGGWMPRRGCQDAACIRAYIVQ